MTIKKILFYLDLWIVLSLMFLQVFNQWQLAQLHDRMNRQQPTVSDTNTQPKTVASSPEIQLAVATVIPRGIPEMPYGKELGISFDNPEQAIGILAKFDVEPDQMELNDELMKRYIDIGSSTACEYCCGATTLVFNDGRRACACAHSAAMRGLAIYLLKTYEKQFDNQQILTEINRWKALFFPRQTVQKVLVAQAKTGQLDPTVLNQLPKQVGGC